MLLRRDAEALRLFRALLGQWRMAELGAAPVALDYTALDTVARWMEIAPDARAFAAIRIMEDEALTVFAERRT